LLKAIRARPDNPLAPNAYRQLADSLFRFDLFERAAETYRILLETYSDLPQAEQVILLRANALFRAKRHAEAAGLYQRIAEQTTNAVLRAECLFHQAEVWMTDGQLTEAIALYATVSTEYAESPWATRALLQQAIAQERLGRLPLARTLYQQVVAREENSNAAAYALLRIGMLQAETGETEAALRTYSTLIDSAQHKDILEEALLKRGVLYHRHYRFLNAMKDFATLAESGTTRQDEARYAIVQCLYGLGRDKDARDAATTFIAEYPESRYLPDMMIWLGKFDTNRGKYADARKYFQEYLTRWPNHALADTVLLWVARAASSEGDFTAVAELTAQFLRNYPESPRLNDVRLLQANSFIQQARLNDAIRILNRIIADTAATPRCIQIAKQHKADALFALGVDQPDYYVQALALYRELTTQPGVSASSMLKLNQSIARCLERLKRINEALDVYYADIIIRYQNDRDAGVWLDDATLGIVLRAAVDAADLYELNKGRPDQAANVLERVLPYANSLSATEIRQRIERLRNR